MNLYAIRDCVAGCFDGVFSFRNNAEAIRSFYSICLDTGCMYGRFSRDYDLYCVGTFDENTGTLIPLDTPSFVEHGSVVKERYTPVKDGVMAVDIAKAIKSAEARGAAVGGATPPEDKPAVPADNSPSLPLDQVAPEEGSQNKSK